LSNIVSKKRREKKLVFYFIVAQVAETTIVVLGTDLDIVVESKGMVFFNYMFL
jgi:hypothetical protein